MLKSLCHRPETVFALVLLWKAALLIFTAQPIPANDAFFYDGAVVNYLLQGRYCNPSLVNALPISGAEVFSAYPPLYPLALLGWMSVAGTSVLAAMWLHFGLFTLYAALVLATLRALRVPVWGAHCAGLFLLGITFHDRPDSLAHVFGLAAVYATARVVGSGAAAGARRPARPWGWLAAINVVLCLGTSLQIGGIYLLLIWLALWLPSWLQSRPLHRLHPGHELVEPKVRPPWLPLAVMILVPVGLGLGVKLLWPHLWAGFQEHAQQTPSVTSWRKPEVLEVIKIIRSVPGLLLVLALLPMRVLPASCRLCWNGSADGTMPSGSRGGPQTLDARQLVILLSASVAAIAVLVGALFLLTANLVLIATYLQPLVVGVFLALWAGVERSRFRLAGVRMLLGFAVLLASIRAIGLTTFGVACALDASERQVRQQIADELKAVPSNDVVVLSSAYLYDAWPEAHRLKLRHSDWLGPAAKNRPDAEVEALRAVKPARLILTQFDYYRRYGRVLAQLQSAAGVASVRVQNLARVRPPDASPHWQRVVQHVSWAPVIVTLDWADPAR
jgi:hypothetical protein